MDPLTEGVGLQLLDEHQILNNVATMLSPNYMSPVLAANPSATLPPMGHHSSSSSSANAKPATATTGTTGTTEAVPQVWQIRSLIFASTTLIVNPLFFCFNFIRCSQNRDCKNWSVKSIPPSNWTKRWKSCSCRWPMISWRTPSMPLACSPNIAKWPKSKWKMSNCIWNGIGTCGYPVSVPTSCGHTNAQPSPRLTNNDWRSFARLSRNTKRSGMDRVFCFFSYLNSVLSSAVH